MDVDLADVNSDDAGEVALFEQYRSSKDELLRDKIFLTYSSLVESVCRGFIGRGSSEFEDLLQVGYLGLLGAIERFDLEREVKFATYARHCIGGQVRHFIRDRSETIRRPRWMKKLSREVATFLERYLQEHSCLPTLSQIAEACNVSEGGVVAILRAKQPLSLEDDSLYSREPLDRIRSLQHESFKLPIEDRIAIAQAFEKLLGVEKKVIYLFFVHDLTQRQIAGKLSLPPRKVSRLMQKGLERLRKWLEVDVDK